MRRVPLLVPLLLPALLAGCVGPFADQPSPCARLAPVGWTPDHVAGEPVVVRARIENCGQEGLAVPTCADGSLVLGFTVEGFEEPRDVSVPYCPSSTDQGRTQPPGSRTLAPGESLEGTARWSGKLQRCSVLCDPPRAPPPGQYALALRVPDVEAAATVPLVLRAGEDQGT